MRTTHLAVALLMVALFGLPAAGQTLADLLQKGIYTQETVGDLDGAIKIYQQIVASGADARNYAAQAQYRLGLCLLKKGDNAGAVKAFQQLIQDYPEQKDLVAKAAAYVPAEIKLLGTPWADDELLEYRLKLPGGAEIGAMVVTAEGSTARPQNANLQTRIYANGPTQLSRVEVNRDTMQPVSSWYFNQVLGEYQKDYSGLQFKLQPKGKEASTVALDGPTYDNEEVLQLLRRLPLGTGYTVKLPIMSPTGMAIKLDWTVLGVEDVQVPAGKHRCYKVQISDLKQNYYVGMEAPRLVVKIDAGGVTMELASVRKIDRVTPVEYRDGKVGLTLTATPGWIMDPVTVPQVSETKVQMLDPVGKAFAQIWGHVVQTDKAQIARQMQIDMDDQLKIQAGQLKDYHVRPGSVQPRQVGGQAALSVFADYVDGERKMVEYNVWVRTENSRCRLTARTAAADFDEFRKRFDPIVETLKLK